MKLKYKENQSEEFYRKLLLLDKLKPSLLMSHKQYIFNKGYCWDLLFNDKDGPSICYSYAWDVLKGPFPEGEPYIVKNVYYSFWYAAEILIAPFPLGEEIIATDSLFAIKYAMDILKDRFPIAEITIIEGPWCDIYTDFLENIGKLHELRI